MSVHQKVRAGQVFFFRPVLIDRLDANEHLQRAGLEVGDEVRVCKNKHDRPHNNVMGHCYIEFLDGRFIGLVCCNSLSKE